MCVWVVCDWFYVGINFKVWIFIILCNVFYSEVCWVCFKGDYDEGVVECVLCIFFLQDSVVEFGDVLCVLYMILDIYCEVFMLVVVGSYFYEEIVQICGIVLGMVKSCICCVWVMLSNVLELGQFFDFRYNFVFICDVIDMYFDELVWIVNVDFGEVVVV